MTFITRRDFGALTFVSAAAAMMAANPAAAAGTKMERRKMGTMKVSLTGLGLAQLGTDGDYKKAESIIHAALDHGINFFDTGQNYGEVKEGTEREIGAFVAEEFLGRALGKRRKQAYIATKCGYDDGHMPRTWIGLKDLEAQCDKSLKKLGTDYIDMYQLRRANDDPRTGRPGGGRGGGPGGGGGAGGFSGPGGQPLVQNAPNATGTPMDEVFGQLNRLIEKGKVLNIGTSNGNAQSLLEQDAVAKTAGKARWVGTQTGFNLLSRRVETDLLPTLKQLNIGLIPTGPLANGFLTGKYHLNEAPPAESSAAKNPEAWSKRLTDEKNFKIIQALEAWAKDHGHTVLDLAFAYIAAYPEVTSIIAGASKEEQVIQNAKATEWKLKPTQVAEVTKIAASFDDRVMPQAQP